MLEIDPLSLICTLNFTIALHKGKLLDRSGKSKHVVWVNWEHLDEAPVRDTSYSHLQAELL